MGNPVICNRRLLIMSFDLAAPVAGLLRAVLIPAALAIPLAAAPVLAQAPAEQAPAATPEAPAPVDPATVLATVGSVEVTEADLMLAAEELQAELQAAPGSQRQAGPGDLHRAHRRQDRRSRG